MGNGVEGTEPEITEAQYLSFVEEEIAWFKSRAMPHQWFYNISRTALVVTGVTMPLYVDVKLWASFASVAMALLAALEGIFKSGDLWKHFRGVQLSLESMRRTYIRARTQEADPNAKRKLYDDFASGVEALLHREAEEYWQMRITPLTQRPPASPVQSHSSAQLPTGQPTGTKEK